MLQISSIVKNPQRGQARTDWRVAVIARAISSGWLPRDWTIHKAIRSAERGPIPGICRNCAIRSRIDDGYSAFLKTRDSLVLQWRLGQLQGKRLEPAEIQLQGAIFFIVRAACTLKLRVRFSPAFFPIKDDAIPERVAPGDLVP